jgi:FKBP-type peptidyl-prolyl cis-trans isomerase FkpA
MSKKNLITGIAVGAALAVIALFFIVLNPTNMDSLLSGAGNTDPNGGTTPTQLVVQDEVVGTGSQAKVGDTVSVNYTGKLQNGTVFDTSVGKNPIKFQLGAGQVIQGWEEGIQGMKVGGKRLLIIPSSLGYGNTTYGPIPANSTLVFEVELVGVNQ